MQNQQFLQLRSWPRAILHIDCDAFFASCEQAVHPELKGKPVITGKERGIVAAASYEAKSKGIKRGVPLWDVKKLCPDAIILPSDYETYSLFSKRMFEIIRRYTPSVEEYSIDEAFAEITGFRRAYHANYETIAMRIKNDIESNLGIT
ncbi:DNA polymerase IV, partial [Candidatus Peregrinibacteria bacterium]|nr:DNA polymerase IV [Candidatus Peregrinibacteria bacterium]